MLVTIKMMKIHNSIKKRINEIRLLCNKLNIQEFSLFGSTINGEFQEGKSDIDCLVKTRSEDVYKIVLLEFELKKMFNTKIDIFHSDWHLHPEIAEYIEKNKLIIFQTRTTNEPLSKPKA